MSDSNGQWYLTYVDQTGNVDFKDMIVAGKFLVGREHGNLKIGIGSVSRRHVELEPRGTNEILIRDLRSAFGSVVVTGLSTSPFPWSRGGYQRYLFAEEFFVAVSGSGLEWETDVTVTRIENGEATIATDRALIFFPGGVLIAVSSSARTSRAHSIGMMPGKHLRKSSAYSSMTGHAIGVWEIFKRCGCDVLKLEDLASVAGFMAIVSKGECGPFSAPIIKGFSTTLSGQEFCDQLVACRSPDSISLIVSFYILIFNDPVGGRRYIQPTTGAIVRLSGSTRLVQMPVTREASVGTFCELLDNAIGAISDVKPSALEGIQRVEYLMEAVKKDTEALLEGTLTEYTREALERQAKAQNEAEDKRLSETPSQRAANHMLDKLAQKMGGDKDEFLQWFKDLLSDKG